MLHFLTSFIFKVIQKIFMNIGGNIRWIICQTYNALNSQKYPTNLNYYIDNENNKMDKNGLTVANKNFISVIFLIIIVIVLIEQFENK